MPTINDYLKQAYKDKKNFHKYDKYKPENAFKKMEEDAGVEYRNQLQAEANRNMALQNLAHDVVKKNSEKARQTDARAVHQIKMDRQNAEYQKLYADKIREMPNYESKAKDLEERINEYKDNVKKDHGSLTNEFQLANQKILSDGGYKSLKEMESDYKRMQADINSTRLGGVLNGMNPNYYTPAQAAQKNALDAYNFMSDEMKMDVDMANTPFEKAKRMVYNTLTSLGKGTAMAYGGKVDPDEHYETASEKLLKDKYGLEDNVARYLGENYGNIVDTITTGSQYEKFKEDFKNYSQEEQDLISRYLEVEEYKEKGSEASKIKYVQEQKELKKQLEAFGWDRGNINDAIEKLKVVRDTEAYNKRQQEITEAIMGSTAKAVGYNLLDLATFIPSSIEGIDETIRQKSGAGYINPYSSGYAGLNFANITESATNQKIGDDHPVGQFLYGAGMSTAKSLETMALGAGAGSVGSALGMGETGAKILANLVTLPEFGSSAYQSTLKEGIERGLGTEKASQYAVASAINEMAFEILSFDKAYDLFKKGGKELLEEGYKDGFKAYLKANGIDWLAQSAIEGSEEGITDIANWMADNFINNDMAEELDPKQLALSMGAGTLSGFATGGSATIGGFVSARSVANTVSKNADAVNAIIENAKQMSPNSKARQIADSLKEGDTLTSSQTMDIIASAKAETGVYEAVKSALVEDGMTEAEAEQSIDNIDTAMRTGNIDNLTEAESKQYANLNEGKYDSQLSAGNIEQATSLAVESREIEKQIARNEKAEKKNYKKVITDSLSTLENETLTKATISEYKDQLPSRYASAIRIAYNEGRMASVTGITADDFIKNEKNADVINAIDNVGLAAQAFDLGLNNAKETFAPREVKAPASSEVNAQELLNSGSDLSNTLAAVSATINEHIKLLGGDGEADSRILGSYQRGVGIALNPNGKNEYQTLIHETLEKVKSENAEGYSRIAKTVLEYVQSEKGAEHLSNRLEDYQNAYEVVEGRSNIENIADEYVNDFVSGIFSTEEGVKDFVRYLEGGSKTKLQQVLSDIVDFFETIAKEIRNYLDKHSSMNAGARDGYKTAEKNAKMIRDVVLGEMQRLGMESAVTMTETGKVNYSVETDLLNGIRSGNTKEAEKFLGAKSYSNTNLKSASNYSYSLNMDDALMTKAENKNGKLKYVDEAVLAKAREVRENAQKTLLKYKQYLPEDNVGNVVVSNSSYSKSVENSLVCIRSIVSGYFMDEVSEKVGRPLTIDEQIVASQILMEVTGDMTECAYCYVKNDRASFRAFFNDYYDQYTGVVKDVKANRSAYEKNKNYGYEKFLNGRKSTDPMKARYLKFVEEGLSGKQSLELSDLTTESKRNELIGKGTKGWLVKDAVDYCKGAAWPKSTTRKIRGKSYDYVAYNGSILKWSQSAIDNLNEGFGLRMYSDSDYVPAFLLENMQVVTDASVRGLKMLAYTKDAGFARVFAPSGMGINISVTGAWDTKSGKPVLDASGNYTEDGMMGAPWEEAKAVRSKNENVGIVFIAFDDDMTRWAMNQDWVDVVIPFHSVRTGAKIAEAYHYTNYKGEQEDKKTKDWNKANNLSSISPAIHHNDRDTYLQALKDNNLTPRFERFIDEPNYMKLVNETRSETSPVQPIFDEEAVKSELARIPREGEYGTLKGLNSEQQSDLLGEYVDKAVKEIDPEVRHSVAVSENGTGSDSNADVFSTLNKTFDIPEKMRKLSKSNPKAFDKWLRENAYDPVSNPNGKYEITYRTMQVIDGNLYPPMATIDTNGNMGEHSSLFNWEAAVNDRDEEIANLLDSTIKGRAIWTKGEGNIFKPEGLVSPMSKKDYKASTGLKGKALDNSFAEYKENITSQNDSIWTEWASNPNAMNELWEQGYTPSYKLVKRQGDSLFARYNPYLHSSNQILNDQFAGAYDRDNLQTIMCVVPHSEGNGKFESKFAKDATGWAEWKSGTVASQILANGGEERQVFLSRWLMPVRVMSPAEVAEMYAGYINNTDNPSAIRIPANTVSPQLLEALEDIIPENISYSRTAPSQKKPNGEYKGSYLDRLYNQLKDAKADAKESLQAKIDHAEQMEAKQNYSVDVDSDGNNLSKEQAEYFKDSKVRDKNGKLIPMYHGTPAYGFTVFDYGKQKFGLFGNGFYFTADKNVAEGYKTDKYGNPSENGGIYECYLNITNPIDMDAYANQEKWIQTIADFVGETQSYVEGFLDELISDRAETMNAPEMSIKNSDMFWVMKQVFHDQMFLRYEAEETAQDIIRDMGYDGITHIGGGRYNRNDTNRHRVYIALEQEQIKNVSNVNPTENPDIRYSFDVETYHRNYKNPDYRFTENSGIATPKCSTLKSQFPNVGFGTVAYSNAIKLIKEQVDDAFETLDNVIYTDSVTTNGYRFYYENFDDVDPQILFVRKVNNYGRNAKVSRSSRRIIEGIEPFDGYERLSSGSVRERIGTEDDGKNANGRQTKNTKRSYKNSSNNTSNVSRRSESIDEVNKTRARALDQKPRVTENGKTKIPPKGTSLLNFDFDARNSLDVDSINRTMLADALEGVAQTPEEQSIIDSYRSMINVLEKQQEKLAEVKAEIKEISFTKGKDRSKLPELKKKADRLTRAINAQDKKLLGFEATKSLKSVLDREKANAYKRGIKKGKESLTNYKERRHATDVRTKIKNIRAELEKWTLGRNTDLYIPHNLINGVIDVCTMLDPTGANQNTKVAKKFRNSKEALMNLKKQYDGLKPGKMNYFDFSSEYDENFSDMIEKLADKLGDKPIRDLSNTELEDVYEVLKEIKHTVVNARKLIGYDDKLTSYFAGQNIIDTMRRVRKYGLNKGIFTAGKGGDVFRNWLENPMRAVQEMSGFDDDSMLVSGFKDLNEGRIKADSFRMNVNKTFEAHVNTDRKAFNEAVEKTIDLGIRDRDGKDVKLTKMQMMSAILTWERETANANRKHLDSMVLFPDAELERKGKHAEALDNGVRININDKMIERFEDEMSDWDNGYLDLARNFFRETSRKAIDDTMIQIKGRLIATEKNYFPYKVNADYLSKESENVKFDSTILGMGMLKSVVNNAPQGLVMQGLNGVIARHTNDVAKVYGLAIPIRNWNKIYNMRQTNDAGGLSVKDVLATTWGTKSRDMLEQAVADLQSSRKGDTIPLLNTAKQAFVVSTLASNVSVWMKQAASYPTAGAVLSGGSLTNGLKDYVSANKQELFDEIDAHTPQHWTRRQGMSTVELGDTNQTGGWNNKLNEKMGKAAKFNPMNWIQAMDVGTTGAIWCATKREVESMGYKAGTEEYWNKVTELYNKTLEETQPMYDSLHRAEITKNKAANFIMFQTQPIQNSGILREGAQKYKMAVKRYGKESAEAKAASKTFRKAVTSQLASHFVFTAMTLLSKALMHKMDDYRDEDKELTAESVLAEFMKQYGKNFFGAIVPVFGSYISSFAEKMFSGNRYDVLSDPVVDRVNTFFNDFSKIAEPSWKNYETVFMDVASAFGIPLSNAKNILKGLKLHIEDAINGELGKFEAGVERSTKQKFNIAEKASLKSGSTEEITSTVQEMIDDKVNDGKDEKSAKSTVKSSVTTKYKAKFLEAYRNNDTAEMARIRKILKDTGLYGSADDIVKTTQDWIKKSKG